MCGRYGERARMRKLVLFITCVMHARVCLIGSGGDRPDISVRQALKMTGHVTF